MCGVCASRAPKALLVVEDVKPRRRPGKPKGKYAKVNETQLAALHRAYVEQNLSVRELARRVWQTLGYTSANSCSESLYRLFADRGYQLRSVSDSLVLRNTRHGRRTSGVDSGPEHAAYRRWLKQEQGRYQPTCKAVKVQSPGKGRPCERPALVGSDYCPSHDPGRAARRQANLAAMRARQAHDPKVAFRPVLEQLAPIIDAAPYAAARLHRATGVPHATISRLLKHRPETITVTLAGRLLAAVELEQAA